MKTFKKIIEFLNRMKEIDLWGDKMEDLSNKEEGYIHRVSTQNPYGLIGLILGGIAFTFGPQYGFIPVITLIFCIVTLFTFDKEKEDNPWPFYLGILLSLIGFCMFIIGATHQIIL
ncbi:cell division protein FtsK [Bacillus sp. Cr_A10]|uniref:cell division protein FtsK n=1 Tax=Bacillus sp. Cr_A10 TaxID=3033993 RepID=UPI0023DBDF69|nr:cell division protein FtsK [Bacillus sp. Cr_A10]MDF2066761.1 cell division protein FtsK [Bacillus sp. Cr_A10]